MTSESVKTQTAPLYKRSPWLPRGKARKLIFFGLLVLGIYGAGRHWSFLVLLIASIIVLSPKILLASAYYYGRAALFLGQWFSK